MNESVGAASKAASSEEEPLVPDDFDDDFYKNLMDKVPEITKALRQKDTPESADNVQRLLICSNHYKLTLQIERTHCQELDEEIQHLKERLENAAKLTRMDQDTIAELRNVIEGAWKQKDAAQAREQIVQEDALKLREKMEKLEESVQKLNDRRMELQNRRDEHKERERLNGEIRELHKRILIQRKYTGEVEAMVQTFEDKNKELLKLLDETSSEAYNSKKRIDLLQKELNTIKTDEIRYTETITHIKTQNEKLIKLKVRQNLKILSLKSNLEHLNTQYNVNCNKLAKLTIELEYCISDRDKNKRDLIQRINLLKSREDDIIRLKQDNAQLIKSQESVARKYATLDEGKRFAEDEGLRLKTQLNTQDKELEAMRRIVHHFEKNNDCLTKERDGLKRDLLMEHHTAEECDGMFQESQHEIRALKDTIHIMDVKYKKLMEDFKKVKKEKTKKIDEVQNWIDKVDTLQNEIHLKENSEIELKRAVTDLEVRCSKFQAQHEVITNEKSILQRSCQIADDAKTKLKTEIEKLQNNIETLKGSVAFRDSDIIKHQLQIDRMEKERRMLKTEMRNSQLGLQHTRNELTEKKKENNRFSKSLQEEEQKLSCLKRDFDNIINEKNSVSASLTTKNSEYAQLKSQLDNLQAVYDQTVKQFQQGQDDMHLMRTEIKNLRTERSVLRKDRDSAADLRRELLQMHRVLNQERIKARALQDEMLTPMNVHRWRNLKGKDPERMDLIEKIQVLRKLILSQNVAALQHERALEESQKLCEALKEFMMKLPSHKIREKLNHVRATLSSKERKLKALTAELNTKVLDERNEKIHMEELKSNLANLHLQLSEEKRKKQKLLEERQIIVQMQAQCFSAPSNMQRTLGAGFKITAGF